MDMNLDDLLRVRELREEHRLRTLMQHRLEAERYQKALLEQQNTLKRTHNDMATLEERLERQVTGGVCDVQSLVSHYAGITAKQNEVFTREKEVRRANKRFEAAQVVTDKSRAELMQARADKEKVSYYQDEMERRHALERECAEELEQEETNTDMGRLTNFGPLSNFGQFS